MDKLLAIHPPSSLFSFRSFSLRKTLRRWPNMVPQWIFETNFLPDNQDRPESKQDSNWDSFSCVTDQEPAEPLDSNRIFLNSFFVWASTCNQFTNYISIIHYERGLKLILNIRIRISTPTNKEVPTEAHVYLPNISKPLLYSLPKHQRGENSKLSLICTGRP